MKYEMDEVFTEKWNNGISKGQYTQKVEFLWTEYSTNSWLWVLEKGWFSVKFQSSVREPFKPRQKY